MYSFKRKNLLYRYLVIRYLVIINNGSLKIGYVCGVVI